MYTCQHGENECVVDVLDMCVMYLLSDPKNWTNVNQTIEDSFTNQTKPAWPYIYCMDEAQADPTASEGCFKAANFTNITYTDLQDCYAYQYNDMQAAGKRATDPTNHTYTPWVVVNNTVIQYTDLLLQYICAAYTGPKPPDCPKKPTRSSLFWW